MDPKCPDVVLALASFLPKKAVLTGTMGDAQLKEEVDSYICGTDDGWPHQCGMERRVQTVGSALESCGSQVAFFCGVSLRSYLDSVLMRSILGQLSLVSVGKILLAVSNLLALYRCFFFSGYADEMRRVHALLVQFSLMCVQFLVQDS